MALIGEIRKRSVLLLIVIAVAMLAFIMGDLFRNNGGVNQDTPITNLYGEGITQSEYDQLINRELNKRLSMMPAEQQQLAENSIRTELEETYLNEYLQNEMFRYQYSKLGLNVTRKEFNDIIQGNNITPSVENMYKQDPTFRFFLNSFGQVDKDSINKYMPMLSQGPQGPMFSNYMNFVGESVEKQRYIQKYLNLIEKGLYVTKQEAKKSYIESNSYVNFDFVYQSFSNISDTAVVVTDSDIQSFYNKHKTEKKYEQKDEITFQYVEFPIAPSAEDKQDTRDYLASKKDLFKDAKNDSNFVMLNSDTKDLNFSDKKITDFPQGFDSILNVADTNTVIGPYEEDGFYKLAKVREVTSKKEAKVRHILIGFDNPQRGTMRYGSDLDKLKKIADSVIAVIRAKNNFDEMVKEMSTDIASVPNGGVYDWFGEDEQFVQPFKDAAFNNPVNSIKAVETVFGIHIIEVMGRRNTKALNVAVVDAEIKPSGTTIELAINKAIDFRNDFNKNNVEDTAFVNTARRSGLFVNPSQRLALNQEYLQGFDNNVGSFLEWGFNADTEKGDISEALVFDKKVIISHLKKKTEKGVPTFADVKDIMKYEVIKEKKAEMYTEKMKGSSINEIAAAVGLTVQSASNISGNASNVSGAGNEPKMIGAAFGLEQGKMSQPIKGKNGVFVVLTKEKTTATIPDGYTFETEQNIASSQLRRQAQSQVYQALYELSELEDKRARFRYIGR